MLDVYLPRAQNAPQCLPSCSNLLLSQLQGCCLTSQPRPKAAILAHLLLRLRVRYVARLVTPKIGHHFISEHISAPASQQDGLELSGDLGHSNNASDV